MKTKVLLFVATMALMLFSIFSCSKEKDAKDTQSELIQKILDKDTTVKDKSLHYVEYNGVYIKLTERGTGNYDIGKDSVTMTYTGKVLQDNYQFDRNNTITMHIKDLIPGWKIALEYIPKLSKGTVIIPYNLGYGDSRIGHVEPFSTLMFDFVLKDN